VARDRAWEKPAPKIITAKLNFEGTNGFTLALWLHPSADNSRDVPLFSSINYSGSPRMSAMDGPGSSADRRRDRVVHQRTFSGYSLRVAAKTRRFERANAACDGDYTGGSERRCAHLCGWRPNWQRASSTTYFGGPSKRDFLVARTNTKSGARGTDVDEAPVFLACFPRRKCAPLFAAEALPYALARIETHGTNENERSWLRDALIANTDRSRAVVERRAELWEKYLALQTRWRRPR